MFKSVKKTPFENDSAPQNWKQYGILCQEYENAEQDVCKESE